MQQSTASVSSRWSLRTSWPGDGLGFSTSDLAASRRFYTTGLGMDESPTGTFAVTDASGSGTITESAYSPAAFVDRCGGEQAAHDRLCQRWRSLRSSDSSVASIRWPRG
jgi:hypothetical protein